MLDEFDAMRAHGAMADQWFEQSRESRISMTAGSAARQLIDAMTRSDQTEEAKRARPKGGRGRANRPAKRGRHR